MEHKRVVARRRPQSERRRTTRSQLLAATIECLVEQGYHGTTTLEVERRAAVSRGARIHHFPTKQDLLAAAADDLFMRLSTHYDEALTQLIGQRPNTPTAHSALQLIWRVYRQPEYTAVQELSIAARTDSALRARLLSVRETHLQLACNAICRYLPTLPSHVALELVNTVHAAMFGLLASRGLKQDEVTEAAVLRHLEELVLQRIQEDAPASA